MRMLDPDIGCILRTDSKISILLHMLLYVLYKELEILRWSSTFLIVDLPNFCVSVLDTGYIYDCKGESTKKKFTWNATPTHIAYEYPWVLALLPNNTIEVTTHSAFFSLSSFHSSSLFLLL